MFLLLFFVLALLPFSTEAGEIKWGREAKPHSRPYMAFITEKFCGGFLVREDVVLTAAHCNGRNIRVLLGAHNIKKKEPTQQFIPVLKAIPHKDYNNITLVNDIMLLKLKHKATLNAAVRTIALPTSQDWVRPGQVCSVAGWGRTANGRVSDILQEVDLEVQDEKKCRGISNYHNSIQLCVGDPKDKKATDKGDSGGPFVCNNVAQGIVSYHLKIGNFPRVFTRISSFTSWIQWAMKLL